jgi:TatD DNase family protein
VHEKTLDMNETIVDTHCHLYLEDFDTDLEAVLERARNVGVKRIYMPSIDSDHSERMLRVEKAYPGTCYSMLGLHPCSVKDDFMQELGFIRSALKNYQFVGIGEIGLDYYWDRSFDDQQMICFREQIRLAKQYNLPIIIHSRDSMDACVNVLREEKFPGMKGIFHCFTGNLQNAHDIIELGMLLGIGGVVTYKNSGLANVVKDIPLDNLVLETDAPYLTPVPYRGNRNESSYLQYVVEKIALTKGVSKEEVAKVTTDNANRVFNYD